MMEEVIIVRSGPRGCFFLEVLVVIDSGMVTHGGTASIFSKSVLEQLERYSFKKNHRVGVEHPFIHYSL